MDAVTILGVLVVGFGAGVLSGLFGVGGAVLTTPGIRALGVSPIHAVGSTIPAILPAAITGALRYAREGLVDRRIALVCGFTGSALAVGGSIVADVVDARWLMVATALLLLWTGISSIRKARALERSPIEVEATVVAAGSEVIGAGRELHGAEAGAAVSTSTLAGVGALAGFVAGLLGVGGGVIMMPLFLNVLKLPIKVAVGSSLVAVAIFSVPAMISHAYLGHMDWAVALLLVVGTVPGARIGSHIAIGASDRSMQLALGVFFCLIALVYGGRELNAIY